MTDFSSTEVQDDKASWDKVDYVLEKGLARMPSLLDSYDASITAEWPSISTVDKTEFRVRGDAYLQGIIDKATALQNKVNA